MKAFSCFVSRFGRGTATRIAYKVVVDATAKGAMLVVTVAAARTLPRDAFGVFALAVTAGWLLGVATDAGLPMYLARATARERERASAMLRTTVQLRLLLVAAAMAIAALVGWRWAPAGMRLAFAVIVLSQLAGAALETVGHTLRGLGRSEIEAHVHLTQRLVMTASALSVLMLAPTLLGLAVALALPALVALPVMIGVAHAVAAAETKPGFVSGPGERHRGPGSLRTLAREAAPLGAAVLLSALYFRIDVFFVEQWHGLEAVAGYTAVFRIADAIRLIPAAVLAVTFPALCRARDITALTRVATALGAGGLLAGVAIALAAAPLVTAVYGTAYQDAAPMLQLLALAVPLFFLNYALTHQVIGWEGQRAYLGITATALAANLAANGALVPTYGPMGAAAATALTEIVVTAGCVWALADCLRTREAAARATAGA